MTERLVVEKSDLQRRIEGSLLIVLPPLVGGALWWRNGGVPLNMLAVVAAFFLISPLGSLIASFGSGARITPDERMRRALERLARKPFAVLVGGSWLAYSSLFLSVPFSAAAPDFARTLIGFIPALLAVTLFCAALVSFQLRRWHRHYDPARPAERYQSVGQWLKEFLPIQVVCIGAGLAAGFTAAHFVPVPYRFLALGAGWLVGMGIETVAADRFLRRKPLLWSQVGFGGALVVAMLRMGTMFAAFFALYALLEPVVMDTSGDEPFAIFLTIACGLVGFVLGTLLMLLMWALARLGDLRARRANKPDA